MIQIWISTPRAVLIQRQARSRPALLEPGQVSAAEVVDLSCFEHKQIWLAN